jgi:hypothetical protein
VFLLDGRMIHAADRPDALRAMYRDVMTRASAASGFSGRTNQ